MVKEGRLVGCQARSARLNVYVVQMFGPDQAAKDITGSHEWVKPFTWCDPLRLRGRIVGLFADLEPVPLTALLPPFPPALLSG